MSSTPCLQSTPGRPCEYVCDGRRAGRKGCDDRSRTARSTGVLTGLAPQMAPLRPNGWDSGSALVSATNGSVSGSNRTGGYDEGVNVDGPGDQSS
jgi:hypothetical protein